MIKDVEIKIENSVQQIVKDNYRTADIFHRHGITYCCGARIPLADVCKLHGINIDKITRELKLEVRLTPPFSFTKIHQWRLGFLLDYIESVHHLTLRQNLQLAEQYVLSFNESHSRQFSYLQELSTEIQKLHVSLIAYLDEEEKVIFPYIRQIDSANMHNEIYAGLNTGTLKTPVANIYKSQKHELSVSLQECRRLTNNYTPPEKTCITHEVCFAKLAELDHEITQYIYIENEVLYPRASGLENDLSSRK